jgi:hypothetical protein
MLTLFRTQGLFRARLGCRAGPRRRLHEPSFEDPRRHAALGLLVCRISPASRSLKPPEPFAALIDPKADRTCARPVPLVTSPPRDLHGFRSRLPLREQDFARDHPMLAMQSGVACNGFLRGPPFPAWYLTGSRRARLTLHARAPVAVRHVSHLLPKSVGDLDGRPHLTRCTRARRRSSGRLNRPASAALAVEPVH